MQKELEDLESKGGFTFSELANVYGELAKISSNMLKKVRDNNRDGKIQDMSATGQMLEAIRSIEEKSAEPRARCTPTDRETIKRALDPAAMAVRVTGTFWKVTKVALSLGFVYWLTANFLRTEKEPPGGHSECRCSNSLSIGQ